MAINHSVLFTGGPLPIPVTNVVEGENSLPCQVEGHTDTVKLIMQWVDDGTGTLVQSFSLTDDEANDANYGTVAFLYD